MRRILFGLAATMLTIGSASAQTMTSPSTSPSHAGVAAASGNDNQAVATTAANAPVPASGSNSFTQGEARRRIMSQGFALVHDLHKDNNGVWRGTATKAGTSTGVWLDYKGNTGISSAAE